VVFVSYRRVISVQQRASASVHLFESSASALAERIFAFGTIDVSEPIVGDWNGNGVSTVGIVHPVNGNWEWVLRKLNSPEPGGVIC